MQELDIPQIVGAPEPGLFSLEQLLFAAVQVVSHLAGSASMTMRHQALR
jgi:hypothetical protein